jgi:DNA-directed RNA polymerase subunit RPC12/RpoP
MDPVKKVARRSLVCARCGELIPKGSPYWRLSDAGRATRCERCYEITFADSSDDDPDEDKPIKGLIFIVTDPRTGRTLDVFA